MDATTGTPDEAWAGFVEGLRRAGERVAEATVGLDPIERADAYRALLRGLNNQLGRFEVDRERPEMVPFNEWREKMFMDNPDFKYWVADIRDDRRYRITGATGDAVYLSITVYTAASTLDAAASARLDIDDLAALDPDAGSPGATFSVTLSRERPAGDGAWLALPEGASSVWVRQFHRDARTDDLGWCRIDPLDPVDPETIDDGGPVDDPAPPIDPQRFARHLGRLGRTVASFPSVFDHATRHDLAHPNAIRHWSEMTGGAAFTEPNIHYLRGAWQLGPDEALVIEGEPPPCRYWNVLLYSRFLNSLDARARTVSYTDATAHLVGGRFRFVLAGRDPGGAPDRGDWLDTEGRPFGIVVFRFLQAGREPELPALRVVPIAALEPTRSAPTGSTPGSATG